MVTSLNGVGVSPFAMMIHHPQAAKRAGVKEVADPKIQQGRSTAVRRGLDPLSFQIMRTPYQPKGVVGKSLILQFQWLGSGDTASRRCRMFYPGEGTASA